jgi:hypothetical protein
VVDNPGVVVKYEYNIWFASKKYCIYSISKFKTAHNQRVGFYVLLFVKKVKNIANKSK